MEKRQDCPLCNHPSIELQVIAKRPYGFCPTCHGIFAAAETLPDPKEELAQYEMHDNDVEDIRYQNFVRPLVDLVVSRQSTKEKGLDFGAGSGPVTTKMLTDRGYTLQLYDPYFHPCTSVLDETYDYIVSCEVIEHFYRPHETFIQLSTLLAQTGTLYCRTSLIPDDIPFSRWHYKNESTHVFFYHRKTIAWIASHILNCAYTILDRHLLYFSR